MATKTTVLNLDGVNQMNLNVLQRADPGVCQVVGNARHAAKYSFDPKTNQWNKNDIQGALFIVQRSNPPYYRLVILNRAGSSNFEIDITENLQLQSSPPYLIYKTGNGDTGGLWFYNDSEQSSILAILNQVKPNPKQPHPLLSILHGNTATTASSTPSIPAAATSTTIHQPQQPSPSRSMDPGANLLAMLQQHPPPVQPQPIQPQLLHPPPVQPQPMQLQPIQSQPMQPPQLLQHPAPPPNQLPQQSHPLLMLLQQPSVKPADMLPPSGLAPSEHLMNMLQSSPQLPKNQTVKDTPTSLPKSNDIVHSLISTLQEKKHLETNKNLVSPAGKVNMSRAEFGSILQRAVLDDSFVDAVYRAYISETEKSI